MFGSIHVKEQAVIVPEEVFNFVFMEDGASTRIAFESQKIGECPAVKQHGVCAAIHHHRRDDGVQSLGVFFRQRL